MKCDGLMKRVVCLFETITITDDLDMFQQKTIIYLFLESSDRVNDQHYIHLDRIKILTIIELKDVDTSSTQFFFGIQFRLSILI